MHERQDALVAARDAHRHAIMPCRRRRWLMAAAISALVVSFAAAPCWGHAVRCVPLDNAVGVRAEYDNGNPIANADVVVFGPGDPESPLQTGTTDEQGRFFFAAEAAGEWKVQVKDGLGHMASYGFRIADGQAEKPAEQAAEKPSVMNFVVALGVIFGLFGAYSLLRRR